MTNERIIKIITLRQSGLTMTDIAKRLNLSRQRVSKILNTTVRSAERNVSEQSIYRLDISDRTKSMLWNKRVRTVDKLRQSMDKVKRTKQIGDLTIDRINKALVDYDNNDTNVVFVS